MFLHMHMSGISGAKNWGTTGTVAVAAEVRLERETCSQRKGFCTHNDSIVQMDWLGRYDTTDQKLGTFKSRTNLKNERGGFLLSVPTYPVPYRQSIVRNFGQ